MVSGLCYHLPAPVGPYASFEVESPPSPYWGTTYEDHESEKTKQ